MKYRNQKGLATWIKVLIGVVAVFFIVGIGIAIWGFTFAMNMASPEKSKEAAARIVTMKALPANYKYIMNMDLMGVKMVGLQDTSSGIGYFLVNMPGDDKRQLTPEQMLDQIAKKGIPSAGGNGPKDTSIEVRSKGTLMLAGKEAPYVDGVTLDKKGVKHPSVLCLTPAEGGRILLLYAIDQKSQGEEIDIETFKALTDNIEAIK